jgi:hypothetical protein
LIVDHDRRAGDRMGRWLEREGYEVLLCPGPSPPSMTCIGGKGGPCPLVDGANVLVLDLWLQSDSLMIGTSSLEILMYYIATGKPIVAVSHGPDATHLFMEERLAVLEWPVDRAELVETVRTMLAAPAGLGSGPDGP